MINRQLSRLLLCSILGSTTLISGCALVRKDSAPHQQLSLIHISEPTRPY